LIRLAVGWVVLAVGSIIVLAYTLVVTVFPLLALIEIFVAILEAKPAEMLGAIIAAVILRRLQAPALNWMKETLAVLIPRFQGWVGRK
jgi:hypothetical protein